DYVLLKVSPWKGVVRFRKKGKLAPRFARPFEIIEKVSLVAYRLDLSKELNGVLDTFHVSNLKRCLADSTLQVPLDEIRVDAKLNFVEEPVEILEKEFKKLKRSRIAIVKIREFELKHGLLNLVTSKQYYGFEKEDPHAHIHWLNKITSTIKYKDVPNLSIKLMLFPFSIEGATRIWLEKEPPHSILTWEDLISKFINQFFPHSKTTNLRNEITNFQPKFEETFSEAWDRFKDLLRVCPHHGFTELHQHDTFYNALNPTDQDSLNAAAGSNLLTKTPRDALTIIKNKSKVRTSRNKPVVSKVSDNTSSSTTACLSEMVALTDVVNAMLRHVKTSPSEIVKSISESCELWGTASLL
ncbi:reverse transcriptase domain-containing protein, partial [Tanacetum coccineum]